jgi:hypothetical protein
VETYHRTSMVHARESFNLRLRCNEIGGRYAKSRTSSAGQRIEFYGLDRVDYSESRNSCIAELTQNTLVSGHPESEIWDVQIVDLATDEILDLFPCAKGGDCVDALSRAQSEFNKSVGRWAR